MGMRQIDPSFAERILRKYSSTESYGFDSSTLVFYRESLPVGRTNSAYYTELMLKLLVMYQTCEQSGQQLKLNWNLFYQMISRQMSGLSTKVERLMLPVTEQLKTKKNIPEDIFAPESKNESTEVIHRAIAELERQLESFTAGSRDLRPLNGIGAARFRLRFLIRLSAGKPQLLSQILRQMLTVRRESRFTASGQAKEAEKELLDILVRNYYIKEQELIWREEKREQSVQERENQLQAFIRLIEAPKVMTVIRQRIMEADGKRRKKLLQWIRKFETFAVLNFKRDRKRKSQVTQEERKLITQAGGTLSKEESERLEHYFTVKSQVTGRAVDHEIVKLVNRTLKSIVNSHLAITKNNNLVKALGGESPLYLQNLVRERVHEPSASNFLTYRRNLETFLRRFQRNYTFSQVLGNTFFETAEIHPVSWEIRREEHAGLVHPLLLGERNTDVVRRDQWEEARKELLLKQTGQERRINETKRLVETLREKIEIQEKLVSELKREAGRTGIFAQINVDQLTRQVMKKMEDDLRLEKMRRGLL